MKQRETDKVFTGMSAKLKDVLKNSIKSAQRIDLIVSFLMESGVKLILDDLKDAADRGVPIRILTGNYLNITEPSALFLLKTTLKDAIDLRFFNNSEISFHPKSYYFKQPENEELYIGSSNLSTSALTRGVEWNYRIDSNTDAESLESFKNEFEELFNKRSIVIDEPVLKEYSKNWRRPKIYRDLERFESDRKLIPLYEPRGFQIEALAALEVTRAQGADKALIQAATGVGKTYLAAFDSKNAKRVLFIAHRKEILEQAARSFKNVSPEKSQGFFMADIKERDRDVIFASVNSLAKESNLSTFDPESFDYIIIDEFHHAVTKQYRRIIDYFKPDFLLGLTATPERLDRQNVYALCDYNVPYQIDLFKAINHGQLVPYHYYGIYDPTDYSPLKLYNGRYRSEDLDRLYLSDQKRFDLILSHFKKHNPKRSLGFCVSRNHAEAMAKFFSENGIPSKAVYSGKQGPFALDRDQALQDLKSGKLNVIFSVDMFNEGLDIPDVDCVLFLRPTESPIVFFQQLGRGLRKSKGKDFVTVLDFIGNYRKAFLIPRYLSSAEGGKRSVALTALPEDCFVDFDLQLIDLFEQQEKAQQKRRDLVIEEFDRIRDELGHVPSRRELFEEMNGFIYELCSKLPGKDNPFKNYLTFLKKRDLLTPEEERIYNSPAGTFLNLIETTNMTRVYKMPVLKAFIGEEGIRKEIGEKEVVKNWVEFFSNGTNVKDLSYVDSKEELKNINEKNHLRKIKQMPIKHLVQSGKGYFITGETFVLGLCDELDPYRNDAFFIRQFKDILDYRTLDYYRKRYHDEN